MASFHHYLRTAVLFLVFVTISALQFACSIETLLSKVTFITLGLNGNVEDIDTLTGAYLSINNGSVYLGNYKSKTAEMILSQ